MFYKCNYKKSKYTRLEDYYTHDIRVGKIKKIRNIELRFNFLVKE